MRDLASRLGFETLFLRERRKEDCYPSLFPYDRDDDVLEHRHYDLIRVLIEDRDGEPLAEQRLGFISGWKLLGATAMDHHLDIVRAADGESADLCNAAAAVYGSDGLREQDEGFNHNALYLERLYLRPEYRGVGLGSALIRRFIELHDPGTLCAIVLMPNAKAFFPKKRMDDPLASLPKRQAQNRLEAYYKGLGFRRTKVRGIFGMTGEDFWHTMNRAKAA